jgi:1-acyl-sn-glycerol-3-phosphate acyltransferase
MNWFFRFWGAIPVSTTGRSAAGAMKRALTAARSGELLGVFPEGRISLDGALQEGRAGVSVLMQRADVPVVPVAIIGAFEVLPKPARFPRPGWIKVVWGEPIHLSQGDGEDRREAARQLRDQVMTSIKELQDRHRKP